MKQEIKLFSKPEELIQWIQERELPFDISMEDSEMLLGYLEGQMKETKRLFGKIDKRQGYHLILSFKEDEVAPDTAMEITQKFVQEYLGKEYESVYAVHDNTEHVHSHIIFNSVSFVSGKKYRYEKGDWARDIQPITNRLCEEYGLCQHIKRSRKMSKENQFIRMFVIQ